MVARSRRYICDLEDRNRQKYPIRVAESGKADDEATNLKDARNRNRKSKRIKAERRKGVMIIHR